MTFPHSNEGNINCALVNSSGRTVAPLFPIEIRRMLDSRAIHTVTGVTDICRKNFDTVNISIMEEVDWEDRYGELLDLFNKVCKRHNISKCESCRKYRQCIQCACGRRNCEKCTHGEINKVPEYVNCSFCNRRLCRHCTAIYCSNGDHYLCGIFHAGCYGCSANCSSIICNEHAAQSLCTYCNNYFCKGCEVGHYPCRPERCSCGILVYNKTLSECIVCKKTSCNKCESVAIIHRANHAMIPFLILDNRGELPVFLPMEIKLHIWKYLICK